MTTEALFVLSARTIRAKLCKPDVDSGKHVRLTPTALNIFRLLAFYEIAIDGEMSGGASIVFDGLGVTFFGRAFVPAACPGRTEALLEIGELSDLFDDLVGPREIIQRDESAFEIIEGRPSKD